MNVQVLYKCSQCEKQFGMMVELPDEYASYKNAHEQIARDSMYGYAKSVEIHHCESYGGVSGAIDIYGIAKPVGVKLWGPK